MPDTPTRKPFTSLQRKRQAMLTALTNIEHNSAVLRGAIEHLAEAEKTQGGTDDANEAVTNASEALDEAIEDYPDARFDWLNVEGYDAPSMTVTIHEEE